jgi:glycine/D-amino acid oxidase-like deaminating enzyme
MKHEFEIHTSNKVGLDSKEGYIVTRGNTGFLRVLGAEPQWSLMTATADEDHRHIRRCPDQLRLVEAALRLGREIKTEPRVERDRQGREYVKICVINRDAGQAQDEFDKENADLFRRFFEIYDECTDLRTRGENDMRELYDALTSDDDGGDVYLSDGVWLRRDGSLDDRGR